MSSLTSIERQSKCIPFLSRRRSINQPSLTANNSLGLASLCMLRRSARLRSNQHKNRWSFQNLKGKLRSTQNYFWIKDRIRLTAYSIDIIKPSFTTGDRRVTRASY